MRAAPPPLPMGEQPRGAHACSRLSIRCTAALARSFCRQASFFKCQFWSQNLMSLDSGLTSSTTMSNRSIVHRTSGTLQHGTSLDASTVAAGAASMVALIVVARRLAGILKSQMMENPIFKM